ncbi:N-methyltransferase 4-like isoform X2 [Papaver somniferum]|uniref:N-methyltransferase 4-like isoform X2 n=1 Tax=Papaver somniferum TaxID=3469 RepID=UPI000E6FF4ED|nr:N-methyltransferase 4-like isoform X2 [Papaver somniferum]
MDSQDQQGEKKSSGEKILERLAKGEIGDEELKKLIRIRLEKILEWGYKPTLQDQLTSNLDFIKSLKEMEMSGDMEAMNSEQYELPTASVKVSLGNTLKQSACYFKEESMTLDEAEIAAYELNCERAEIKDGQTILDIGCGHGGLVLHIAQKYKNCHVTGMTNSIEQKSYIMLQVEKLKLSNVDVILADVTKFEFETEKKFDRINVIETIEALDEDDWYTSYVLPKGSQTMLSASALLYFQDDVSIVDHWLLNGKHMARSQEEWGKNLNKNLEVAREVLKPGLGSEEEVNQVITHYKTFFIGFAVQFSFNNGEEWMISHVLFKKR